MAPLKKKKKIVDMNGCNISLAFAHLFLPWQNKSKLSFAHLAERKGSETEVEEEA